MIRIIVVEDHAIVRDSLRRLFSLQPDMEVVGTAANGVEAMALLNGGLQTNIVITDANMPGMNGLELTRQVIKLIPDARIIILTLHPQVAAKSLALAAGAKDCLSKDGAIDELLACIRTVHAGPTELVC